MGIYKIIQENKKSVRNFQIFDRLEAGVALAGSEVKSIRESKVSIQEAYCIIKNMQAYVVGMDISRYPPAGALNHDPKRRRKLLLHQYEIKRLYGKASERGMTIIPTKLYINDNGIIKLEIALAKGMAKYDKREKLKKKEIERRLRRFKYRKK